MTLSPEHAASIDKAAAKLSATDPVMQELTYNVMYDGREGALLAAFAGLFDAIRDSLKLNPFPDTTMLATEAVAVVRVIDHLHRRTLQ